jgi:putative thymidine phosphorylase
MELKVKTFGIKTSKPIAFIQEEDAARLGIHSGERISLESHGASFVAVTDTMHGVLKSGEIALSQDLIKKLNVKSNKMIHVTMSPAPKSASIIQKKLECKPYTKKELKKIISDIVSNKISEIEIAYFISGVSHCGMSLDETTFLTEAIFETGRKLTWNSGKVADKHSIGGVPGNRTTPIVVAICAAAGVKMPKTSSRAITSAAGTADTLETIAKVDFSAKELKQIVNKVGACLIWGGSLGLAPADDKLIRVEKVLSLDPEPQLIASILAKKLAAGSKYVLIDIPAGKGAKVSKKEAEKLKSKFLKIGKKLKLKIRVVITNGSQPIGNGVGPILEVKDILRVLRQEDSPKDLEKKCILLSGEILEMVGKSKKGKGKLLAKELLTSGKAFKKFEEIIKAQEGKLTYLKKSKFSQKIKSKKDGKIAHIENKKISYLARLAGCPLDKASGLYLHKHKNEKIKKGETLLTIYSESKQKMKDSLNYLKEEKPIVVE